MLALRFPRVLFFAVFSLLSDLVYCQSSSGAYVFTMLSFDPSCSCTKTIVTSATGFTVSDTLTTATPTTPASSVSTTASSSPSASPSGTYVFTMLSYDPSCSCTKTIISSATGFTVPTTTSAVGQSGSASTSASGSASSSITGSASTTGSTTGSASGSATSATAAKAAHQGASVGSLAAAFFAVLGAVLVI